MEDNIPNFFELKFGPLMKWAREHGVEEQKFEEFETPDDLAKFLNQKFGQKQASNFDKYVVFVRISYFRAQIWPMRTKNLRRSLLRFLLCCKIYLCIPPPPPILWKLLN